MASLVPANNPLSGINMQSALAINPVQQVSVPNAIDKGIDSANRQALDRQNIETNAFNQGVVEEDRAIMNQARTDFQTALTPEDYTEIVGRFDPQSAAEMRFNAPNVALENRIKITAQREAVAKQMHNVTDPVQKQLIYDQAVQTYGQEFAAAFPGGGDDPILAAMGVASVNLLSETDQLRQNTFQLEIQKMQDAALTRKLEGENDALLKTQNMMKRLERFNIAIEQVDRAEAFMNENEFSSTGLVGQIFRNLGGSDALDFGAMVNSINSNLAFNRLQEMRDSSKTGGALGQVSNIELELLKSAIASINPNMTAEQLRISMAAVKKHYKNLAFIAEYNPKDPSDKNYRPDGQEMYPSDYEDFFSSPLNIHQYRADKGWDVEDAKIQGTTGGSFDAKGNPVERFGSILDAENSGGGVIDTLGAGVKSAFSGTSTQPDPNAFDSQTLDGGQLPTVSSKAEFDALPSDAMFLENGKPYRKP